MYMRLVQARVDSDSVSKIQQIYEQSIIPALRETPGCLNAFLMQGGRHSDELVSMTFWEGPDDAEAYVKSGLFARLMDKIRPFLSESSEWRVGLSKDLTLEQTPVPQEPVISAYPISIDIPTRQMMGTSSIDAYLRLVTVRLKPEGREEFQSIYINEILPALQQAQGCRHAYLAMPRKGAAEAISVTLWDSRRDAEAYEQSGEFANLVERAKHTFTDLFQWKMGLDKKVRSQSATTEDLKVEGFTVVAMKNF